MMRPFSRLLIALGLIALGLSACSSDGEEINLPAELTGIENPLAPKVRWQASVGDGSEGYRLSLTPVVQDEAVIVVDRNGVLSFNDLASGEQSQEIETGLGISTGLVAHADLLIAGTTEGEVVALNSKSGEPVWRTRVSSEVLALSRVADGLIIAQCGDGQLHALAVEGGERRWGYQVSVPTLTLRGTSTPLIAEDTVYAGFSNGKVSALNLSDGKIRWVKALATPRGRSELERMVDIDASPIIDAGELFTVTYQGNLTALLGRSGDVLWQRELSSYVGMALAGQVLYVVDDGDNIWAVDRNSGASLWKQEALHGRTLTRPVVDGNYLLVGDFEGYLHWLDREQGRIAGRVRVDEEGLQSPVLVNGKRLFVYGQSGQLALIESIQ